jgi:hypothetical protein
MEDVAGSGSSTFGRLFAFKESRSQSYSRELQHLVSFGNKTIFFSFVKALAYYNACYVVVN